MDLDILRIDTDTRFLWQSKKLISQRLKYANDIGAFPFTHIKQIIFGKKKKWNCKIYLNKELTPEFIIMMQLYLGSDHRKEINTMINHYILKMNYSNRMFDMKRYKNGKVLHATQIDLTKEIKYNVLDPMRKKYAN